MARTTNNPPEARRKRRFPPTLIGWAVRAGSLAFLAILLVVVAREVTASERPPTIVASAEFGKARRGYPSGLIVPVTITNNGTLPAANVVVLFERAGDEPVEVTLPLLGARDHADFELFYPNGEQSFIFEVQSFQRM